MITDRQVIEAALSFQRTPYLHQGRSNNGLDCIGLIIVVAKKLRIPIYDPISEGYSRLPRGTRLLYGMREHLNEIDKPIPGSIFLCSYRTYPQHVGIIGDIIDGKQYIIHVDINQNGCVHTPMPDEISRRLVSLFTFKSFVSVSE